MALHKRPTSFVPREREPLLRAWTSHFLFLIPKPSCTGPHHPSLPRHRLLTRPSCPPPSTSSPCSKQPWPTPNPTQTLPVCLLLTPPPFSHHPTPSTLTDTQQTNREIRAPGRPHRRPGSANRLRHRAPFRRRQPGRWHCYGCGDWEAGARAGQRQQGGKG